MRQSTVSKFLVVLLGSLFLTTAAFGFQVHVKVNKNKAVTAKKVTDVDPKKAAPIVEKTTTSKEVAKEEEEKCPMKAF